MGLRAAWLATPNIAMPAVEPGGRLAVHLGTHLSMPPGMPRRRSLSERAARLGLRPPRYLKRCFSWPQLECRVGTRLPKIVSTNSTWSLKSRSDSARGCSSNAIQADPA